MSFTPMNCPVSFRFLNPEIKKKAIEIANSLLEGGFEVEVSEVIALSNAKLWACYFYEKPKEKNIHVHLVPHPQGWALIPADGAFVYFMYPGKNEALLKARAIAKNEKLKLYIHSVAGNINDSESFVVNRPVPFKSSYSSLEETMEESAPLLVENKRDAVRKGRWVSRPEYASALGKAGY